MVLVTYRIPPSMKKELALICCLLDDGSILLSTFLGHIVPHDPEFEACADACKSSGGGWSTDLLFWWYVVFQMISINDLV